MMLRTLVAALATGPVAVAQFAPVLPFPRTLDLVLVDSTLDGIWRLSDLNLDGDYNDAGEVVAIYDDVAGTVQWTSPTAIVAAEDGTIYAADTAFDRILRHRDLNGDGDMLDAGEHGIFFDPSNAGGLLIATPQGLTVDAIGRVFVAVANAGSPAVGSDTILKLEDLNLDGDANDAGEAVEWYIVPNSATPLGNSIPTKVAVGPDLAVYYTENASTVGGPNTKGVWRLFDLNSNGNANDPGEATLFWTPPFTASPFYWSLAIDASGVCYVTDHSANRQIWRGVDANANGSIEPTEQTLFWSQPTAALWWDVVLRDDGTVLVIDDQTPDRVVALRDLNADGDATDLGEQSNAYDSTVSATAIAPRGGAMMRAPRLQLAPATVPIGQATSFVTAANKPGDLGIAVFSIGLGGPFPVAPWGNVEIDISGFVVLGFGLADATGTFAWPFAVPNTAAAIGTYGVQTLCGDAIRLFLSNAALLTITP